MSRMKKCMIAAIVCIGCGIVVLGTATVVDGRPGIIVNTSGVYMTNDISDKKCTLEKTAVDAFDSVNIEAKAVGVELAAADEYAVEYCVRGENGAPVCEVENGTLTIKERSRQMAFVSFDLAGLGNDEADYYIKVYLPEDTKLEEIQIKDEYGSVQLGNLRAKKVEVKCESGNVVGESLGAEEAKLDIEYGNLFLDHITADTLEMELESGWAMFSNLECREVQAKLEYGDLEAGHFTTEQGSIDMESGNCTLEGAVFDELEIENEYGDVSVTLEDDLDDYGMNLKTEYGSIACDADGSWKEKDGDVEFKKEGAGKKQLRVKCESGDINVVQNWIEDEHHAEPEHDAEIGHHDGAEHHGEE